MKQSRALILLLLSVVSCRSADKQHLVATTAGIPDCCIVSDDGYDRKSILNNFANTLKSLVPDYKGVEKKGFYVSEECQLVEAFIYDLSDTLNRETTLSECIEFREGHVYHFAPIRQRVSYSSIAILIGGEMKIFKAINCPEKGDRLEDAMDYIQKSEIKDKGALLSRVRNYRKYGAYINVDEQSEFKCD